ncbi:TetR/AcrR family transcriptional regulator [Myceligenerans pegani]|uniref:Helix-turn-helix transcriptional regulator n=1 Tax=Myceligenerans pegani TaxID=2776917 RepID=A0ABR9N4H8_9MICO|nr:TetR/AcrR family transcriptional regulator [Myceligenerans sp. TRM 65318]MBE1878582.1 helix-turn-helix transcriptional regulator [Myceligenerans sp. TRM 65318]MBE3020853.1 helix-turn-helix transcriptional regulator [Myceligenerans sp. TRM 65318]
MVTRAETAAATRRALVRAASELLDEGGTDAVTLRAVGARAGVSRGAPYGHFENKERLLARLTVDAWNSLADEVERLRAVPGRPGSRLERAVLALVGISRRRPHLYALMFSTPADTPEAAAAARRLERAFLAIVADVVGEADSLRYGALLMSSAHGIAGLERTGHLAEEKWRISGDQLVSMLIDGIVRSGARNTGSARGMAPG